MGITVTGTPTTTDNAGGTSSSSIVVNVPTGATVGEVLVCHLSTGANNGAVTTPSGWTALQSGPDTFGPTIYGTLAYRVVTGTEAASYTWTTASSSNKYGATMFRVAGANTTTPFRTSALATANAQGTSSSIVTGPTLSGVQATDELFYFWSVGDTSSSTQPAFTMPSSPWSTIYNRGVSSKGTAASHATGNLTRPTVSGGTANDAYVVIGAAMQAGSTTGSGTFSGSGSGTLAVTGTPTPTGTAGFSGSGTLGVTGTPTPNGSLSVTGTGTLTAQPGTVARLSGTGTLIATGATIAVSQSCSLGGTGTFVAGVPNPVGLAGAGTLTATATAVAITDPAPLSVTGTGTLTVPPGQVKLYHFRGPVILDYRPLELLGPGVGLIGYIPYGKTVWRDADGAWHEKHAPQLAETDGAQVVYPGGRIHPLTDQQRLDLTAAGYGDYITLENV